MKNLLLVFALILSAGMTVNAQTAEKKSCSKKCTKTCTKGAKADALSTASVTKVAAQMTEAEIAAEADENVKVKTCSTSGSQSFYQKSVCGTSGNVSWDKVSYCTQSKKFTKVAAASMERDVETGAKVEAPVKKECSKMSKKECSKKCSKTAAKECSKMSKKECAKKCSKGKKATK